MGLTMMFLPQSRVRFLLVVLLQTVTILLLLQPVHLQDTSSSFPPAEFKFLERWTHALQCWALQYPRTSFLFRPLLYSAFWMKESIQYNWGAAIERKRELFGDSFCGAGAVFLTSFDQVSKALVEPQARTARLGTNFLDAAHLPMIPQGGRLLFLLALSDEGAGGDGTREGVHQALYDYVTGNPASFDRQDDETTALLFKNLQDDYLELGHTEAFFKKHSEFVLRYMHYVGFGIDPFDEESLAILRELHYTTYGTAYTFEHLGNVLNLVEREWSSLFEQAADIYYNSPALQNFPENDPQYAGLTKRELAWASSSAFSVAGLPGPNSAASVALGFQPFHNDFWKHNKVPRIDVTEYWDTLDLDDRDEVLRYLLETMRLRTPVTASHRVVTADEEFTVPMRSGPTTFPAGTDVIISLTSAMTDYKFWGDTVWEFDIDRPGLVENHMAFHSIGGTSGVRSCPARTIALKLLVDDLIALGEVRRNPDFPGSSA